jgi:hypothetical protein
MSTDADLAALTAGLAEDEAIARAAAGAPWEIEIPPAVHVSASAIAADKARFGRLGYVGNIEREADREHIARQDPHATLLRVEAIQKVIAMQEAHSSAQYPDFEGGYSSALDDVVEILAGIYTPEESS